MLETIVGIALLPFAIAVGLSLLATIYLIITKGWKGILVGLSALAAVTTYAYQERTWALVLAFITLATFLWAIGAYDDEPAKKDSQTTIAF